MVRNYDGLQPYLHRLYLTQNPRLGGAHADRGVQDVARRFRDLAQSVYKPIENERMSNLGKFLDTTPEGAEQWLGEAVVDSAMISNNVIEKMGKGIKPSELSAAIAEYTSDYLSGVQFKDSSADRYASDVRDAYQTQADIALSGSGRGGTVATAIGTMNEHLLAVLLQSSLDKKLKEVNFNKMVKTVGKEAAGNTGKVKNIDSIVDITIGLGEELGRFDFSLKTTSDKENKINLLRKKDLANLMEADSITDVERDYVKEAIINESYWMEPAYMTKVRMAKVRHPNAEIIDLTGTKYMRITSMKPEVVHPFFKNASLILLEALFIRLLTGFEQGNPNVFTVVAKLKNGKSGIIRTSSVLEGIADILINPAKRADTSYVKTEFYGNLDRTPIDLYDQSISWDSAKWKKQTDSAIESTYNKIQVLTNFMHGNQSIPDLMDVFAIKGN